MSNNHVMRRSHALRPSLALIFSMTSSTEQASSTSETARLVEETINVNGEEFRVLKVTNLPGSSEPSSSSGVVQKTVNINGEEMQVLQLTNFSIEEHLKKLHQRREASEKRREKKHPFIPPKTGTPVNALPNELLSSIFALGSEAEEHGGDDAEDEEEEEEDDSEGEDRRRLPFKVLVSHVCRRWRMVAVETSMLWTFLDFAEGPPFDKSRTWLERSKGCLLDIELDCTDPDEDANSDESDDRVDGSSSNDLVPPEDRVAMPGGPAPIKPKQTTSLDRVSPADLPVVRDLILPHVARWRIFEFMVNDYQIMYGILSTLAPIPEAPQLQVLRLYHYDDNDDYDHFKPPHLKQPFAPFCGRAPNLLQVALWGVHVDWESCAFLRGLEELELAYHTRDVRPSYEIFARILERSPDLHILTLCASGPAGRPEDWPSDVIELRSVKHLILAFVEPAYASALMKRLVFPNLSTLALDFDTGDYSAFLAQLARPAPHQQRPSVCQNLVDLKISGMQCSPAAVAAFYAALPNLVSLNINCYHVPSQFFEYLFPGASGTKDENGGCYLPKLETLTTSNVSGEEMRALLSKRKAVPIKHLLMDSGADVDIDEEAWLCRHVETFEFFDGSDDEDDDDLVIGELDEDQEMENEPPAGDGDGVPGEWVDDNDIPIH